MLRHVRRSATSGSRDFQAKSSVQRRVNAFNAAREHDEDRAYLGQQRERAGKIADLDMQMKQEPAHPQAPRDRYWRIFALKLPPEREKKANGRAGQANGDAQGEAPPRSAVALIR
jgi:hypothetical protein